ncbi:hypothetical protein QMM25_13310 [Leptospira santarosai]|nr:hypothetical protein [Leptospira santarosai]MDI7183622.1 hypothetical protein [Leptospira santarosai]
MENGIYGLMLFLTIGLLFFSWNVFWKSYLVDRTREDLFALRDRLFELGLKQNGIKFSDPAYQSFEAIINGTIRFTHRISFLRYVIFRSLTNLFMSGYKISSTLGIELDQGVKKLDSRGQMNLKPLLEEYERIVISHLVFKSFS